MVEMFAAAIAPRFSRPELVSAVFFVGFCNASAELVFRAVDALGVAGAIGSTFGISVFVFACFYMVLQKGLASAPVDFSNYDIVFWSGLMLLFAVPHPALSWIALTALGLREYWLSSSETARRGAAVLMIGLTVPMFWGRLLFSMMSSWLLALDATFVSAVTNLPHQGNIVILANHAGTVLIGPPCSSVANASLAMLCWLMFTESTGRPRSARDYATCFWAIVGVVAINITRISMIALRPDFYQTIHGPTGSAVVAYISTIAVLAICAFGVRREVVAFDKGPGYADRSAVARGT